MIQVRWETKNGGHYWEIKSVKQIPPDLMDLMIKYTHKRVAWFGFKLCMGYENIEDLEQDLLVRAIESLKKYEYKKSSFHTYLDRIYDNYLKNINNPHRPALREKHGMGRIEYNSEWVMSLDKNITREIECEELE